MFESSKGKFARLEEARTRSNQSPKILDAKEDAGDSPTYDVPRNNRFEGLSKVDRRYSGKPTRPTLNSLVVPRGTQELRRYSKQKKSIMAGAGFDFENSKGSKLDLIKSLRKDSVATTRDDRKQRDETSSKSSSRSKKTPRKSAEESSKSEANSPSTNSAEDIVSTLRMPIPRRDVSSDSKTEENGGKKMVSNVKGKEPPLDLSDDSSNKKMKTKEEGEKTKTKKKKKKKKKKKRTKEQDKIVSKQSKTASNVSDGKNMPDAVSTSSVTSTAAEASTVSKEKEKKTKTKMTVSHDNSDGISEENNDAATLEQISSTNVTKRKGTSAKRDSKKNVAKRANGLRPERSDEEGMRSKKSDATTSLKVKNEERSKGREKKASASGKDPRAEKKKKVAVSAKRPGHATATKPPIRATRTDTVSSAKSAQKRAELLARTRDFLRKRPDVIDDFVPLTKTHMNVTADVRSKAVLETSAMEEKEGDDVELESKKPEIVGPKREVRIGRMVRFPSPPFAKVVWKGHRKGRKISGHPFDSTGEDCVEESQKHDSVAESNGDSSKVDDREGKEETSEKDALLSQKRRRKTDRKRGSLLRRLAVATSSAFGRVGTAMAVELAGAAVGLFGLMPLPEKKAADGGGASKTPTCDPALYCTSSSGARIEPLPANVEERDDDRDLLQPLAQIEILRSGWIPGNSFVQHPSVRVHIVNRYTGEYIRKSCDHRGIVSSVEHCTLLSRDGKGVARRHPVYCPIVRPTMTSPASHNRKPGSNYRALWNEAIVYNLHLAELLHSRNLILFELVDFGSAIPEKFIHRGGGYHRVAWAFLHPVSAGGNVRVGRGKELHLSLYKYPARGTVSPLVKLQARSRSMKGLGDPSLVPDVFLLYQKRKRKRYPSTLTVRIQPVTHDSRHIATRNAEESSTSPFVFREVESGACLPTELEVSDVRRLSTRKEDKRETSDSKAILAKTGVDIERIGETKLKSIRARTSGDACEIPSSFHLRLRGGARGNTAVSFVPSGGFVVVACAETNHCPIRLYNLSKGSAIAELRGHTRIVHQLTWTWEDATKSFLLCSASSDSTVKVWDVREIIMGVRTNVSDGRGPIVILPKMTLPHPNNSFVYALAAPPVTRAPTPLGALCISGGYDRELRLWSIEQKGKIAGKLRPMPHASHEAHINSVAFGTRGRKFFSADASGALLVWRVHTPIVSGDSFEVLRRIRSVGKGMSIDTICARPLSSGASEIAIFAGGGVLQSREATAPYPIANKFIGFDRHVKSSSSQKLACCYSPDGKYLMAGSRDGNVRVWDATSGVQISHPDAEIDCALFFNFADPVSGVAWSRAEHAIAVVVSSGLSVSGSEACHPVLVYASYS